MRLKISFLVVILSLFIAAGSFAEEVHTFKIEKGKLFLDEKYCFSIDDNKDKIVKS